MRQKSSNAIKHQQVIHMELRKREEVPDDPVAEAHLQVYSNLAEKELKPVQHEVVVGECRPDHFECNDEEVWSATDTLLHPNSIHQTASLDRLILAEETGYQELCIDAADTVGADNSLEKMLAHQMAACHAEGMRLVVNARKAKDEIVSLKMLNAATRFMEVFQKGFEAIHKVKRGNRQTVVVRYQQVNVNDGGQAVIAEMTGGAMQGRGDAKK